MIHKKISILLFCLLFAGLSYQPARACEACGCSLGGFNFGIIPQTDTHFVGVKFSRARFFASVAHTGQVPEHSHDSYYRWDLMGRFALSERWQLNLVLPYLYNDMNGSHEQHKLNGMGDPMVLMNYKLLQQKATADDQWIHNLWVGTGVKAPVGSFAYNQNEQLINPNFQLGTGSWDVLVTGNYMVNYNRYGLNVEAVYKMNTVNSQQYRFGNQANGQVNLFYNLPSGKLNLVPFAGLYAEYGGKHTFEGFFEANSGGKAVFANAGLQVQGKGLLLNLNYQNPIRQRFNSDRHVHIDARERFSVAVLFLINKGAGASPFRIK